MQTANYLEQAKSFLNNNASRLALRAVPLAMIAVAVAHANPSFGVPNSMGVGTPTCLSGGGAAANAGTNPSFGSLSTDANLGISLFGSASLQGPSFSDTCTFTLQWKGGGSGTLYGSTGSLNSGISITNVPDDITVNSYTITVFINGTQEGVYHCQGPGFLPT